MDDAYGFGEHGSLDAAKACQTTELTNGGLRNLQSMVNCDNADAQWLWCIALTLLQERIAVNPHSFVEEFGQRTVYCLNHMNQGN